MRKKDIPVFYVDKRYVIFSKCDRGRGACKTGPLKYQSQNVVIK